MVPTGAWPRPKQTTSGFEKQNPFTDAVVSSRANTATLVEQAGCRNMVKMLAARGFPEGLMHLGAHLYTDPAAHW